MKKLLGIVVLGLLWFNVGFAKTINDFIKIEMTKKNIYKCFRKLF